MSRLSNRDVDSIVWMEYEDALSEGKEWAVESHQVRYWASLDGKRVVVEDPETAKPYEGIWQWHGATGDDFWLVYINDEDGNLIVGTDPRNFTSVRPAAEGGIGASDRTERG